MDLTKTRVSTKEFQMKYSWIVIILLALTTVFVCSTSYAQSGEWTEISTFSSLNMPGVAAVGQKIYIIGGSLGGESGPHTNNVRIFDTSTNSWEVEGSLMPTARYALGLGVSGSKLYAIGGGTGYAVRTNVVEEYDPVSDTWVVKNPMRVRRQELGIATVDSKIYVIGGDIISYNSNAVEEFDPSTNTWVDKATYDPPPQVRSSAAALGQYIYVFGGFFGYWGDSVSVFDTVANTWDHSRTMPLAQNRHGVCQLNGEFYIAAGHHGGATELDTFWKYTPGSDTWTSLPSLPQGSYNVDLVSVGNSLFLVDSNHGKIYEIEADFQPDEPDIALLEDELDFGEIPINSSETDFIVIGNEGTAPLTITDIYGLGTPFSFPSFPTLPIILDPDDYDSVLVNFAPTEEGFFEDTIHIVSNDPDESHLEIPVHGTGFATPSIKMELIIDFFENSVNDGTLEGAGKGKSAKNSLNKFANMLQESLRLIEAELYEEALQQLRSALKACDGIPSPPDFVAGEDRIELARKIVDLILNTEEIVPEIILELDDSPMLLLSIGVPVSIGGTILKEGIPLANSSFIVEDGIGLVCYYLTTDSDGRFSFTTTPLSAGAAIVEYIVGLQVISTSYEIVENDTVSNIICSAIQLENASDSTYTALVTSRFGDQPLTYSIAPGETKTLVQTESSFFDIQPKAYVGVHYGLGAGVADLGVSVLVDEDKVAKLKLTGGGAGKLRFSVYGTTKLDFGLCWSPGGYVGAVSGVGGEFNICLGSDGFSTYAMGTLGHVTSGFGVEITKD